jgi:hypothetical protein
MRDSDQWIEKSDYLRLRSLTLGYTFDKAFLEKDHQSINLELMYKDRTYLL